MVMNRLEHWPILLLGLWLSGSQVSNAQSAPQPLSQQHVDAVVGHLTRTMDTTAQAERNPRYVGVQLTTCPIQITGPAASEGVYLYQEQALSESLNSPYRQRFLHIVLSADATRIESRTFKPPRPEEWAGLCEQSGPTQSEPTQSEPTQSEPTFVATVEAIELGNLVCTVSLRPSVLGYVGSTPEEGCPVDLRGAVRLTNTIVLHQDGMDSWDRGFDENGIQVWGARAEPYQYRWLGNEP
ncbi:chromophore lyase CpcT/CpeT [Leptothoe sp. PORK10 BA2]|uniref:chromophore lyase CpcT/CpeT n=1 Tax=Leptothoe sp. PORK10 BA2 TaxID=3110254 RepID=UPI002B2044AC|nr:chromophore lyase CpcT/CpeT [Leptothoe sp. PORK10 BA2]MEA5466369.1 chromophore lyase CpcT/CpeT [Leptothoe sp. PORK10 BA2]